MTAKARLLAAAAGAARVVAWILLRTLPPKAHAVVHSWPDNEANALEVVRALGRRYPGTVYWLLDDPAYDGPGSLRVATDERVVRVKRRSPRAVHASLTAELTFFTHGLYTAVTPPKNRLVVNLWHGDGPKATRDAHLVRSTVAVSGSRLWGDYKSRLFRLSAQDVAVVGNPRIDQFGTSPSPAALARLGLGGGRPVVLWLPTYREARGPRARAWNDGENLTGNDQVHDLALALADEALALGVDLVIKPHPLDTDSYDDLGLSVVRGTDLDAAGVSLYQLIGHCAALISDISSAWVDFIVLDRPVGFFIPDLDEIQERRGLNVDDLESLLPGPRISGADDARKFLRSVVTAAPELRPSSYPGYARIGIAGEPPAVTDTLLDWLDVYQERRGRYSLFGPDSLDGKKEG